MSDLLNAFKGKALTVAEFFTPVLKESKFKETGVLTPNEFVIAGDHLVHHCPSWNWASGDQDKLKPYLPKDKQFLYTKKVPCFKRCKEIENLDNHEKIIDSDDVDGGWVDTHHFSNLSEQIQDMTISSKDDNEIFENKNETDKNLQVSDYDDNYDEAGDMDEFIDEIQEDNKTLDVSKIKVQSKVKKNQDVDINNEIVPTRTYDLNITYDKYYQTPRLWLTGYNEFQKPLSIDEMYEDISQDHAKKTVTMETHPHIFGGPVASVHPCKHADVMKKIISTVEEGGRELNVHSYLIVFLKFVQAVIPTIEYDYTQNIQI